MTFKTNEKFKNQQKLNILQLACLRNHVYVTGKYLTKESKLVIFCKNHKQHFTTTFTNYKRSRTGLPCCGNQKKSILLKNRIFTKKSLQQMKESAKTRKTKTRIIGNEWRRTKKYRVWEKMVRKQWNSECALTGYKPTQNEKDFLVIHHFYSFNKDFSPELLEFLRFLPENGILICKVVHKAFHDKYGYRNNTIFQFLNFLESLINTSIKSMPISSQVFQEWNKGSETRVYDPGRVMKLHERLGKIQIL
jgi:hypothetical protein